jgi:23S rRNA pseudouridine1911/1915/1917 synthase
MEQHFEFTVPETSKGERLDKFLTFIDELELTRSYIQKLIRGRFISCDAKECKANQKLKTGQIITLTIPEPEKLDLVGQEIPLNIIYEDNDLIVINKQPGLVVHPGPGNPDNTLVNGLLYHFSGLSTIGGIERPGIVHRLDRDTSGVMIVAKNDKSHLSLSKQFQESTVKKFYCAIVTGRMRENPLLIEEPIGRHPVYRQKMTVLPNGRDAKTKAESLSSWTVNSTVFTQLRVQIFTGRTHQIRVHLSSRGHPVVGDPVYSKNYSKYNVPFLMLAAIKISFTHPVSGQIMTFEAPLPDHMNKFLEQLKDKAK